MRRLLVSGSGRNGSNRLNSRARVFSRPAVLDRGEVGALKAATSGGMGAMERMAGGSSLTASGAGGGASSRSRSFLSFMTSNMAGVFSHTSQWQFPLNKQHIIFRKIENVIQIIFYT